MAFRTLQATISLLLLLLVCLHFTTEKCNATTSSREKCECIEESKFELWRKIKDYKIIEKDPLCNKVQIILQLSRKQVCLNPESNQGEKLQKCWKRIKFNTQKKRVCLTRRKGPKRPKKQ